jgi:hypothetical protein
MKLKIAWAILPILLLAPSCGGKADRRGVDLSLTLTPAAVTDSLFLKLDFDFKTAADFKKLDPGYRVFVHFWRTNSKEMLLQDDHLPVKDAGAWVANDRVRYARTVFIPQFLNEFDVDFEGYEEIKLSAGLYKPDSQEKPIALFEKKLNVQPASINAPEIVYDEGWNEIETDANAAEPFTKSWRWTTARSVCVIENPKKDCTLLIKGGVNKNVIPDQKLTLKLNGALLEEFVPDALFTREYTVTPEMMGNAEEFTLEFLSDKVFTPNKVYPDSKDNRELGMQLFFLYFREKVK